MGSNSSRQQAQAKAVNQAVEADRDDVIDNLTDAQLDAIAANGGLVGIGFWPTAVCGEDAAAIARAIRDTADRIGLHHVALGSDFDGAVTTPFDANGLPRLTAALQAEGFDAGAIARIMGENQIDFLLQNLPTAVTP